MRKAGSWIRFSDINDTANFRHNVSSQLPFRTFLSVIQLFPHCPSSLAGFFSLLPNSQSSEGSNDDQPPIGPFEGCVEPWRAIFGCLCLCFGYVIVVKGDNRLSLVCGAGFVLTGTFIWLTGHTRCDGANQQSGQQPFHSGKSVTQKYLTTFNYRNTVIGMANVLNKDKQIAIIGALAEGSSIRSIERMTGVHRDTIMRLGVKVGQGMRDASGFQDADLACHYLQFDEIWGFIGKKQRHVRVDDDPEIGDVWTFCAIDAETKTRADVQGAASANRATANAFVQDVANWMRNRVQISTDALHGYIEAIEKPSGRKWIIGQIVKIYTARSMHST